MKRRGQTQTIKPLSVYDKADSSCPPEKQVRRAGKIEGAQGYGRKAPERIDLIKAHVPNSCACCDLSLPARKTVAYTGHYEVDWIRTDRGDWQTHHIKNIFGIKHHVNAVI